MLKRRFFYLLCFSFVLLASCDMDTWQEKMDFGDGFVSTAQWQSGNGKKGKAIIGIRTRIGHKQEVCDGTCTPTPTGHKDCQGRGEECPVYANIEMEPIVKSAAGKSDVYAARCLYPEDLSDYEVFSMPERSFKFEDEDVWLNIPAQLLERDAATRCFIIKNITFTKEALYVDL